jgi:hypothetical protein
VKGGTLELELELELELWFRVQDSGLRVQG